MSNKSSHKRIMIHIHQCIKKILNKINKKHGYYCTIHNRLPLTDESLNCLTVPYKTHAPQICPSVRPLSMDLPPCYKLVCDQ